MSHYQRVDTNQITIVPIQDDHWQQPWNAFVDCNPRCSIYHRFEFKTIIENSFNHNTIYLAAINSQQEICGILPSVQLKSRLFGNFFVSMPFFNYGGPVARSAAIEDKLIQELIKQATNAGAQHVEFRDMCQRHNYPCVAEKVAMFLQLTEKTETLWQDIGSKVRAQIRKAQRNKLTVSVGGKELLDDFYGVFSENMRDLGTPVYSKGFFLDLLNQPLNTHLVTVYAENKPVSCAFLLGGKSTLEIPWASTLRKANPLNANMLLYWTVLCYAIEQKYEWFDFGRSSKDSGTFKFKKQWGAKPQPLYWHYWLKDAKEIPKLNPTNPKYKLAIGLWKKLPLWVANCVGPPIVKNLP